MDVNLTHCGMRVEAIDGIAMGYHLIVDEIMGSGREKEHGDHQAPPDPMQK